MDLPLFFISDIHLLLNPNGGEAGRQQRLFRFLDHVQASGGTLFIVGDLFDFWFEYKQVMPKVYFPFLTKLYALKESGTEINYLLGNHDYWVMDFITDTLMTNTYFDDISFEANGKKFYITHGDGLLSWDRTYRVLKRMLRNPLFVKSFRALHPNIGYAFANWVSRRGRHFVHTDEYNRRIVEDLLGFADERFAEGFDYLITGHYHQARQVERNGRHLLILGDWINYFTYGEFDGQSLILKTWET